MFFAKNIAIKIGVELTDISECKTKEKFTRLFFCWKNCVMVAYIFCFQRDEKDESGNYYYLSYCCKRCRWQFSLGSGDCFMYIEATGRIFGFIIDIKQILGSNKFF